MKLFEFSLRKEIFMTFEIEASNEESAYKKMEKRIDEGLEESFCDDDGWEIDECSEVTE